MTIPHQEQFCICCNTWGSPDTMQPLYLIRDPETDPCLWLHDDCAQTCANVQFEAAMKRFESHVNMLSGSHACGAADYNARLRAQVHFAEIAKAASISLIALRRAKAALEKAQAGPPGTISSRSANLSLEDGIEKAG